MSIETTQCTMAVCKHTFKIPFTANGNNHYDALIVFRDWFCFPPTGGKNGFFRSVCVWGGGGSKCHTKLIEMSYHIE